VLFGIVVVWALGLDDRGVDIVGHIDSGLSSLGLPEVAAAVLGQVPGADGHYGDILRHPENPQAAGIVVLRLESGLFFANADAVRDVLRRTDGERLPLSAYPTVREAIAALTHRL
jgi:MFS superfamily sulfate permease-like transporter